MGRKKIQISRITDERNRQVIRNNSIDVHSRNDSAQLYIFGSCNNRENFSSAHVAEILFRLLSFKEKYRKDF